MSLINASSDIAARAPELTSHSFRVFFALCLFESLAVPATIISAHLTEQPIKRQASAFVRTFGMRWFSTRRKTSTKSGLSSIQRRRKMSSHTARQCPRSSSFESSAGSSLPAARQGGEKFIFSLHELHHVNHSRVLQLTKERRHGCSRRSLFRFHIPAHSWCARGVAANGSQPSEPAPVLVMETAFASSRRSAPPIAASIRLSGTVLLSCTGIGPLQSFAKVRQTLVPH